MGEAPATCPVALVDGILEVEAITGELAQNRGKDWQATSGAKMHMKQSASMASRDQASAARPPSCVHAHEQLEGLPKLDELRSYGA